MDYNEYKCPGCGAIYVSDYDFDHMHSCQGCGLVYKTGETAYIPVAEGECNHNHVVVLRTAGMVVYHCQDCGEEDKESFGTIKES